MRIVYCLVIVLVGTLLALPGIIVAHLPLKQETRQKLFNISGICATICMVIDSIMMALFSGILGNISLPCFGCSVGLSITETSFLCSQCGYVTVSLIGFIIGGISAVLLSFSIMYIMHSLLYCLTKNDAQEDDITNDRGGFKDGTCL